MNFQCDTESEQMAGEIEALFKAEDAYLLLTQGACVRGYEDIAGLRVVANALFDEVHRDWKAVEKHLGSDAHGKTRRSALGRLTRIKKALEQKRQVTKRWFVLCYHVYGTRDWAFVWSLNLSRRDAIRELLTFLKSGMLFEELAH